MKGTSGFSGSSHGELLPSEKDPISSVSPLEVVPQIGKHVLIDGFQLVVDLQTSRGCRLVDSVSGRTFLDLYSFFASMPIGFNHPAFSRPAVEGELLLAAKTKVANSDVYTRQYARFVSTFSRVMGHPELPQYFFIDGGALAVENAVKAAMDWKVRKNLAAGRGEIGTEILHFRWGFHGRSGYTLSLTNTDPKKTDYFARFSWPRVAAPWLDFRLSPDEREKEAALRETEIAREIETCFREREHRIAAILIEPIQGEGGDNHFRGDWLRRLREICDRHDCLLIFDEVQTGMGLTGRNWCFEHFNAVPDLLCFGKKSQICGVMAGPRLDEVEENVFRLPGRINSTFGGNLTDMVRATFYLEIIEQERLVDHVATVGGCFLEQLRRLSEAEPIISAVRGRGLMLAFDLPDATTREKFYKQLYRTGLLAIRSGTRAIRFRPTLDLPASAVDEAMDLIREACTRLRKEEK